MTHIHLFTLLSGCPARQPFLHPPRGCASLSIDGLVNLFPSIERLSVVKTGRFFVGSPGSRYQRASCSAIRDKRAAAYRCSLPKFRPSERPCGWTNATPPEHGYPRRGGGTTQVTVDVFRRVALGLDAWKCEDKTGLPVTKRRGATAPGRARQTSRMRSHRLMS
jgi:hypothetical protein